MKNSLSLLAALAFALAIHPTQAAPAPHTPETVASMPRATVDVPSDAQAAVLVVDSFGKALAAVDMKSVENMLDPRVIILESGGAERSREEYLGHHAIADAAFLAGAHVVLLRRTARVDGDLAWVASENELHATEGGKPMTLLSTETMVLHKTADGWHIVHIHWSSRPKTDT